MKESATKETIKTAAKNLFFKKGNIHATTQDIANEAGVNRALIHYYFSSREQLFEVILKDALQNIAKRLQKAVSSDSSFEEKIKNFVSSYIDEAIEFPFMESFIASEFNRYSDIHFSFVSDTTTNSVMEGFFKELLIEMKKGTIPSMSPEQFLINITSMCSFPLITKPLIQKSFYMDDKAYLEFIKKRKVEILKMIFK
jgi:AcrR family transcriptional regulator